MRYNLLNVIGSLHLGGAEKVLLTTLRKIDKEKFNPMVCCIGEGGELLEEIKKLGIHVEILNSSRFYDVVGILKLSRFMKRNKVDIVHSHLFESDIMARLAAKIARIPIVVSTYHNIYPWKKSLKIKKRIKTFVDRITANYCTDQLIAVAEVVKKFHVENVGIKSDKIIMIPNSIDLDEFKLRNDFDPLKKRKELLLKPSVPVIINIASLSSQKGQKYLLLAATEVLKILPEAIFMIVGDGPLSSELKRDAKKLKISKNVNFLGARNDIPELLAISDIFVLSSLWEGMPIVLLEAMAMKKPIIATNVGGIPEVVVNERNGILVPPGNSKVLVDAIIDLLKDKEKAERMGIVGRKKVEECFSANVIVKRLERLYEMRIL